MQSAIQPSCFDCVLRPDRLFCDLPADALEAFDAIKVVNTYPRGTILFREGHPGKRLTLRTAGAGEVLGLSALLSGASYELTAELLENSQVVTVKRKDLLRFLRDHREACLQVVHLLSQDLHVAYDRVRSVGLGRTRKAHAARVH